MQRFLMKTLTLGTKARTAKYNQPSGRASNVKAHMLQKSKAKVIRNGLSFFNYTSAVCSCKEIFGTLVRFATGIFID